MEGDAGENEEGRRQCSRLGFWGNTLFGGKRGHTGALPVYSYAVIPIGKGCFKNCLAGLCFLHARSSLPGRIRSLSVFPGHGDWIVPESDDSKGEGERW